MAVTAEEVRVIVDAKVDSALKGLEQTDKKTNVLTNSLKKLVGPAAIGALVVGAVKVGSEFSKLASEAEEVNSKFNTVFKEQAASVRDWAANYASAFGQSQTDTLGFLATIQDTLVPLGFARDAASDFSTEIVALAGDLASFNNLPTADVVRDIQSAVVGNTETLRKYGVVASQAAIEQEALNSGISDGEGALTAQEKAAAILSLTLKGTTDAQGDLERTQDSSANVTRQLENSYKDLGIAYGEIINESLTPLKSALVDIITEQTRLIEQSKTLRDSIEGFIETGEATGDLVSLNEQLEAVTVKLASATGFETLQLLNLKSALEEAIEAQEQLNIAQDSASRRAAEFADKYKAVVAEINEEEENRAEIQALLTQTINERLPAEQKEINLLQEQIDFWAQYREIAGVQQLLNELIKERNDLIEGQNEIAETGLSITQEQLSSYETYYSALEGIETKYYADLHEKKLQDIEDEKERQAEIEKTTATIESGLGASINAFAQSIAAGESFNEALAEAAKEAGATILNTLGQQALAQAAAYTAASLVPGGQANIPAAIAYGTAATAAFTGAAAIQAFATGGDFVTNGPQMIMVGDNPGGRERVQVTPIGSPNVNGPGAGKLVIEFRPQGLVKPIQTLINNQEILIR